MDGGPGQVRIRRGPAARAAGRRRRGGVGSALPARRREMSLAMRKAMGSMRSWWRGIAIRANYLLAYVISCVHARSTPPAHVRRGRAAALLLARGGGAG